LYFVFPLARNNYRLNVSVYGYKILFYIKMYPALLQKGGNSASDGKVAPEIRAII
jgi:hypothetical protein